MDIDVVHDFLGRYVKPMEVLLSSGNKFFNLHSLFPFKWHVVQSASKIRDTYLTVPFPSLSHLITVHGSSQS